MNALLLPGIHFIALIALLTWKVKTPFGTFIKNRHTTVSEGLNRSKLQVANAESRRREIEMRVANLDSERKVIAQEWKERELAQAQAIRDGSKKMLEQMKSDAQKNRHFMEVSFREETIQNLGKAILAQAEKKIVSGLNADSHQRVNAQYARQLETQ